MAGEAVSARETIDRLTIELGADGSKLSPEMASALAKAQSQLETAQKAMERAQAASSRAIQSKIDTINATRPTAEMRLLEQAVSRMGGAANMNAGQVARLRAEITALAAAGAKVPASLQGLSGGNLTQAFAALTSGGGVSGALSALGPAGVAAAAGFGAVAMGARSAYNSIKELAGQAEQWSNTATSTGLGVQQVQQLSDLLEDAGIPAEALWTGMKILQKEIANGGAQLQKFGIDVSALKDLSPEEQLRQMAETIASIKDPAVRTAASLAAFGRSGNDLIPVLENIADGAYQAFTALNDEETATLQHADEVLDEFDRKWTNFWRKFRANAVEGIGAIVAAPSTQTSGATFIPGVGFVPTPPAAQPPPKAPTIYGPAQETDEERRRREAEEARQRRQAAYDSAHKPGAKEAAAEARRLERERVAAIRERVQVGEEVTAEERAELAALVESAEMERKMRDWERERRETQGIYNQGLARQNQTWGRIAQQMRAGGASSEQISTWLQSMGVSAEEAAIFIERWAEPFETVAAKAQAAGKSIDEIREDLQRMGASPAAIEAALASIGVQTLDWGNALQECGSTISSMGGLWDVVGSAISAAGVSVKAFGDESATAAQKAGRIAGAIGSVASAAGQALGGFQTRTGGMLSGAGMGMQAGSAFGGWGALIGGAIGAGAGAFAGGRNEDRNELEMFRSNWSRLVTYVRSNPLFKGDELDPLLGQLQDTQSELQRILSEARTTRQAMPQADWKRSLLMGFSVGGSARETWASLLSAGPLAHIFGSGPNEAEIAGNLMRESGMFNWEAMFVQAQEWGLDLRSAYEEGGEQLNEALTQYLDLADEQQRLQEQEAELQAQKRRDLEEGLTAAAAGAKLMQEALEKGEFSAAAERAARELISKVRQALVAAGMGYQLDTRLNENKAYQNASQLATGASQLMAGSRQAGIIDAGMMAAGGVVADEAKRAAYEAAKAAGLSEEQAQKAGFGAVSGLLREQLNASIQSGQALDDNTKRLLDEAKRNGINIVADPLVEQIKIQRDMLAELGIISGSIGKTDQQDNNGTDNGTGVDSNGIPTDEERRRQEEEGRRHARTGIFGAAKGIYNTVRTPNLGNGLSWMVQTHPNEQMVILPSGVAPQGAVVIPRENLSASSRTLRTAAAGVYASTGPSTGGGLPGGSTGGGGLPGGSTDGTGIPGGSTTGGGGAAAPGGQTTVPVNVTVQQSINENPMASAESRSEARQFTLDAADKALRDGSHPLAATVANIVDQKIRAALAARR